MPGLLPGRAAPGRLTPPRPRPPLPHPPAPQAPAAAAKAGKKQKFTIDVSAPAGDKVLDVANFAAYLQAHIKVAKKAGNLGEAVKVSTQAGWLLAAWLLAAGCWLRAAAARRARAAARSRAPADAADA